MKKFLVSLIIIMMLCLVPTSAVAFADEPAVTPTPAVDYYKVNADGACFFSKIANADAFKPEFELPKTYYFIKGDLTNGLTDYAGTMFIPIKYNGLSGYMMQTDIDNKTLKATEVDLGKLTEENAYFNTKLSIKLDYVTEDNITISANTMLNYLGKLQSNSSPLKYAFKFNNKIISIPAETYFSAVTVPDHTFPVDNNSNTIIGGETESPYNKLSTNILIVGIAVACVVMVIIIYKPKKKDKSREDYYDDGDYYEGYKDRYHTRNQR